MIRRVGPFVVTGTMEHFFGVEIIITKVRNDVHVSRHKNYSETALEVNERLSDHVSTQGLVLGLREICDKCYNDSASLWERKVDWDGREDAEASWDPF